MPTPCPYCNNDVVEKKDVDANNYAQCKACLLPFHKECYELNGKCMCYGCNGKEVSYVPIKTELIKAGLTDLVVKEESSLAVVNKAVASHMRILEELVKIYDNLYGEHDEKVQRAIRYVCNDAFPQDITSVYALYLNEYRLDKETHLKIWYKIKDPFPASMTDKYFFMGLCTVLGAIVGGMAFCLPASTFFGSVAGYFAGEIYFEKKQKSDLQQKQHLAEQQRNALQKAHLEKIVNLNKRYQRKLLEALR